MPESAHLDSEANNGSSELVPKKCRKQSVKVRQRFLKCVPLLSIKQLTQLMRPSSPAFYPVNDADSWRGMCLIISSKGRIS